MNKREVLKENEKMEEKRPYAPPAIIYNGTISTRAGSPIGGSNDPEAGAVDPADLFSN
jgi:hypothetical protein